MSAPCACQHIDLVHAYLPATRTNTGRCLALGCGCGGFQQREGEVA